jgi:hypothetical protein
MPNDDERYRDDDACSKKPDRLAGEAIEIHDPAYCEQCTDDQRQNE